MGKKKRANNGAKTGLANDWISNLARQSTTVDAPSRPKRERIEQRKAKKRRREERRSVNVNETHAPSTDARRATMVKKDFSAKQMQKRVNAISNAIAKRTEHNRSADKKRPAPFQFQNKAAAKHKKLNWTEDDIQPRTRDYGGIGLARQSLFLSLDDPAFTPKLEQEFEEHIHGFFGRARTKAMKKQLDKNMLWRQLAEKKNKSINGKKLSKLSPDERVEAMIAAGLV